MADADPLLIWQITDTHLLQDPDGHLLGAHTRHCLDAVLAHGLSALPRRPDLLLLTGDLSHDGSEASYAALGERLARVGLPARCLPGNHDLHNAMLRLQAYPGVDLGGRVSLGAWQLLLVDSVIPGSNNGAIADRELQRIEQTLANDPRHCLVALHHHPLPVGSRWMDRMQVGNGNELLALLARFEQVRLVVFGHVHQAVRQQYGSITLLGAPATCVQFMPGQADFGIDPAAAPGSRFLELAADGSFRSEVMRVPMARTGSHDGS